VTGKGRQPAPGHGPGRREGAKDSLAVLEQDFDADSLYALRSAVAAHAAEAGLSEDRVYDVVVGAHELAANAVRHGAGHGRLRLRAADGILTCQVSDSGPATADGDGNAGPEQGAPWPAEHGRGLWVVGQVADEFEIERGRDGTIATAAFSLSGAPPAEVARPGPAS
jgi:anti-sigma regulatory factor (Ser/Thr protein kinase)